MKALAISAAVTARIALLPAWIVGLLVGGIGAGAAWWYYNGLFEWWHVWLYLATATSALVLAWIGLRRVRDHPVEAMQMIGARTLAALLIAGLASAVLIAVAIEIIPPGSKPTGEMTELYGAISAVIAAAITGSLVKVSESIDGPAAGMAESALTGAFRDLKEGSHAWKAVYLDGYAGKWGWGPDEREWRAAEAVTGSRPVAASVVPPAEREAGGSSAGG